MKPKLLYALLILVVAASGCFTNKSAPTPIPAGTFTGEFRRVHVNLKTTVADTQKANITLNLDLTTGFAVTGDTSTVHAGSHGGYSISSTYALFNDVTYSPTAKQTKVHLAGTYSYYYDGSTFQMVLNSAFDTLSYQYDLKKTN